MKNIIEKKINNFIGSKKISHRKILSCSFGIICEKFTLTNKSSFVAKYYKTKNYNFNSIISETNSLTYLLKKFPELFPLIKYQSEELLITDFIQNNNIRNEDYQKVLANEVLKLHKIKNDKYGFDFDAQIGGLKQSNEYESNWVNFFRDKRLNMIFETINRTHQMPNLINKKIESLLKSLEDHIPKKPNVSLLHGDLWSGNILFNNGKVAGLIDPGIYFGHNEFEISYLMWFKYIDKEFLDYYSNILKIDKYYYNYEPIYQLYFSLLNIHLWSRKYLKDTESLLKKII